LAKETFFDCKSFGAKKEYYCKQSECAIAFKELPHAALLCFVLSRLFVGCKQQQTNKQRVCTYANWEGDCISVAIAATVSFCIREELKYALKRSVLHANLEQSSFKSLLFYILRLRYDL
jgi:hypothetical protein